MFKTRHLHLCCLLLGLPTSQCWKERQRPEEEETRILWLHPAILWLSKWWTPSGYIQTGIKPLRHAHWLVLSLRISFEGLFWCNNHLIPGGEGWNEGVPSAQIPDTRFFYTSVSVCVSTGFDTTNGITETNSVLFFCTVLPLLCVHVGLFVCADIGVWSASVHIASESSMNPFL